MKLAQIPEVSRETVIATLLEKGGITMTVPQSEITDASIINAQHQVINNLFDRLSKLNDEVQRVDDDTKQFYREAARNSIRVYRENGKLKLERIPIENI